MKLLIIRHGDPDYANDSLTEKGHNEAKALSEYLDGVRIDRIYASPMGRARATAEYTCRRKEMEKHILPWTAESMDYMWPYRPDSACEYRFSIADGVTDYKDFWEEDRMGTIHRMIAGSDAFLARLGYRRSGYHYEVTEENSETVAVFCHGGFGSAWIAHLLGMAPTIGFSCFTLDTTSVTAFSFGGKKGELIRPRLYKLNDCTHLLDREKK